MSLHDQLRALFLLDQQLRGLRVRLDGATQSRQAQQTKLDRLAQQHRELCEQHLQMQAKANNLQKLSEEQEERVVRLREQMNNAKNNKEYQSLLVEVSTLKNEKGKIEEQALEQMGKAEALQKQAQEMQGKVEEQKKIVTVTEKEIEAARAEVGDRLDRLTLERQAAAGELPEPTLAIFEKLCREFDGDLMADVQEESRRHKEYTCGGCFLSLPIERVNALLVRDDVVTCPGCGRILFIDPQLKSDLLTPATRK